MSEIIPSYGKKCKLKKQIKAQQVSSQNKKKQFRAPKFLIKALNTEAHIGG